MATESSTSNMSPISSASTSTSTSNQTVPPLTSNIAALAAHAARFTALASSLASRAAALAPPTPAAYADAADAWAVAADAMVDLATALAAASPPPLASPQAAEIEPMPASTYRRNLPSRLIDDLDETLCWVGRNEGPMSNLLKSCGFTLGLDFSKKFDLNKPIDPADYHKFVIYGIIVVLLFYIGLLMRMSRMAHRFTGIAVLSAVAKFLWMLLSGVPSPWRVVFVGVCGAILCLGRKMTT